METRLRFLLYTSTISTMPAANIDCTFEYPRTKAWTQEATQKLNKVFKWIFR